MNRSSSSELNCGIKPDKRSPRPGSAEILFYGSLSPSVRYTMHASVCVFVWLCLSASVRALACVCRRQIILPPTVTLEINSFRCGSTASLKPLTAAFKWHRWMEGFYMEDATDILSQHYPRFKYDTHTEHQSSSGSLSITCDDILPTRARRSECICSRLEVLHWRRVQIIISAARVACCRAAVVQLKKRVRIHRLLAVSFLPLGKFWSADFFPCMSYIK